MTTQNQASQGYIARSCLKRTLSERNIQRNKRKEKNRKEKRFGEMTPWVRLLLEHEDPSSDLQNPPKAKCTHCFYGNVLGKGRRLPGNLQLAWHTQKTVNVLSEVESEGRLKWFQTGAMAHVYPWMHTETYL